MQLVWIESKKEEEEINKIMKEKDVEEIWTAGTNPNLDGKWRWDFGGQPLPISRYANWCPEEPDNYDGDELYLVKTFVESTNTSCWKDLGPLATKNFICKPPLSSRVLMDSLIAMQSRLDCI